LTFLPLVGIEVLRSCFSTNDGRPQQLHQSGYDRFQAAPVLSEDVLCDIRVTTCEVARGPQKFRRAGRLAGGLVATATFCFAFALDEGLAELVRLELKDLGLLLVDLALLGELI
jgi:hypothetical protein